MTSPYPYIPGPSLPGATSPAAIDAVANIITQYAGEDITVNALARLWMYQVEPEAIRAALRLSDHAGTAHRGTKHAPRLRGQGPAARATQRAELTYRAAYILNSAYRLNAQLAAGKSINEALQQERGFYALHELARRNRQKSGMAVDLAADKYGNVLGWHTHKDDRTTVDCRAAGGNNFNAKTMPRIGWPGSVHPHCRCWAGPPFATLNNVDEVTVGLSH